MEKYYTHFERLIKESGGPFIMGTEVIHKSTELKTLNVLIQFLSDILHVQKSRNFL